MESAVIPPVPAIEEAANIVATPLQWNDEPKLEATVRLNNPHVRVPPPAVGSMEISPDT